MDFLGSLISGGMNLLGGLFGQSNQQKINQENIRQANFVAGGGNLPALRANAEKAGFNPLAVLGQNMGSPAVSVGSDAMAQGIGRAGQDIGGAVSAYMDSNSKKEKLAQELVQAQIDRTRADTVATLAQSSKVATNLGTPGRTPTMRGPKPLFEEFVDKTGAHVTLLSHDASQSVMNSSSLPMAIPLGVGLVTENLGNMYRTLRPDVQRSINNLGSWITDSVSMTGGR